MGFFNFLTSVKTVAAAIFLPILLLLSASQIQASELPYRQGEIVIKLSDSAHLPAIAAAYNLIPQPLDQFGTRPIYLMAIQDGADPQARAAQLLSDSGQRVVYAEPNFITGSPENTRESWSVGGAGGSGAGNWYRQRIRLPEAHSYSRGSGITVAILDTGVDRTHPALAEKLIAGFDFVDFDDDPGEEGVYRVNPGFGHGTHVAGLVAAVAPDAKIVPVRVLDENGVGNIWVLAEALGYVAALDPDGDPATDDKVRVINLSLSTKRETALLKDIVGDITCGFSDDGDDDDEEGNGGRTIPVTQRPECLTEGRSGIVVIAAAGNSGANIKEYPAAETEKIGGVLAVAASNRQDRRTGFSTWGDWTEISAPGVALISTVPGGGYGVWSGTSMSAPLVAGQAALVRAHFRQRRLTSTQVVNHIISSSVVVGGQVPFRIDAAASLAAIP